MTHGARSEVVRSGSVRFGRLADQVAQIGADLRRRLVGLGGPSRTATRPRPGPRPGRAPSDRPDGQRLGERPPRALSGAAVGAAGAAAARRLAGAADLADILAGIAAVLARLATDLQASDDARRAAVRLAADHGFLLGPGGAVPMRPMPGLGVLRGCPTASGRILADSREAYAKAAESRWAAAAEAEVAADARASAALYALATRADALARRHPARWLERFVAVGTLRAVALAGVALPVDPAAVRAAVRQIVEAVGDGSLSGRELRAMEGAMGDLLPGEQEALVAALDRETLARLGRQIGVDDAANPLDRHTRLRLMGAIAAAAPRAMLPELLRDFPSLRPTLAGLPPASGAVARGARIRLGAGGLTYAEPAVPLVAAGISADDVEQGRLADCFFLAPLMGLALEHPEFVARHLRRNPNGTVTVTFFRGGKSLPVTVTPDLPYDERAGVFPFARLAVSGRPAEIWPALYEKAYAQLDGAYGDLEGGLAAQAMRDLGGGEVRRWNPAHHSAAQVRALLAQGYVVTAATSGGRLLGVFGTDPGPLVGRHEYVVTAVGADGDVTFRNPWGPAGTRRLTWSQVRAHVATLTIGAVPPVDRG